MYTYKIMEIFEIFEDTCSISFPKIFPIINTFKTIYSCCVDGFGLYTFILKT